MRTSLKSSAPRALAAALVTALALTSLDLAPAQAASASPQAKQSITTEFSARRHWRRGNGAVLGAVAGVFGAIAYSAARNRYRDDYYYGGGPYAYYGAPAPYYYGPGFRYRHWRRW